jgi:PAS domain S-box-containing protein
MNPNARPSILLVDDRPENLLALEALLEPLNANLVRANSGDEALKRILAQEFAVILLDVQMPGLNGFETAKLIKSREKSRFIPIIFLTAISKDEQFVFEGYSVGAVDYMFKPFPPDVLRSKVSVFMDLYYKQQQIKEQEQRLRESERRELELRHIAKLGETEARMAEVVDSAMDAIITFDEQRTITLFNAAAERLFGCTAGDAIDKDIADFISPAFTDEYLATVCEAAPAQTPHGAAGNGAEPRAAQVESFTGIRVGGDEIPLEASISCLDLPAGKTWTLIARDVTERKAAEEALRSQAVSLANSAAELTALNEELHRRQAELERAMSARNRFYASMSHELRTPINAIIGYNTLLLDHIFGPLNEKQQRGVERTHKAAKHLLELVNDILDLSKIEAGKMEVDLQQVEFPHLVEDLFVTVQPLADEKGSKLSMIMEGGPRTIISDPRRLRQILLNLLSNAIKFGDGKPIDVVCRPAEEGRFEIEVIDRGQGIQPEDVARIFDEFIQLARPKRPQQGAQQEGTGLGLPISRGLAKLLGGSLQVESTPGQGSTFRLTVPMNTKHSAEQHAGV